ncbi:MAG: DMT family transporter [Betaproteobacteria bacterium]|nr:DMT family transporter [Betaproteobacteria bacterium]
MSRAARWAPLYLAASMALVGANVALGKLIVAAVPVLAFLLLRGLLSCALFAPEFARHLRAGVPLTPAERRNLFWQALLGIVGFSVFMLFGLRLTTATAAGVITSTIPAAVAVLSWLLLRERLSARVISSVVLAVAGVAVLNLGPVLYSQGYAAFAGQSLLGNALVLCAVFCEASYVVQAKRLTGTLGAARISAFANLYALVIVLPFGLWSLRDVNVSAIDAKLVAVMAWYIVAASVVCFWLWMKGIAHVSASRAGVFTACLPIAAALMAVLVLGERFTAFHVVALALVIVGVWLAATDRA